MTGDTYDPISIYGYIVKDLKKIQQEYKYMYGFDLVYCVDEAWEGMNISSFDIYKDWGGQAYLGIIIDNRNIDDIPNIKERLKTNETINFLIDNGALEDNLMFETKIILYYESDRLENLFD